MDDAAVEHAARWVVAYLTQMQSVLAQLRDVAVAQGADTVSIDSDDLHRACTYAADAECGKLDIAALSKWLLADMN